MAKTPNPEYSFTAIEDVKRGSFSCYTDLGKNNHLMFNVVCCSRCSQPMAAGTILVKTELDNIRKKQAKNREDGKELYSLSCNDMNKDPEQPICKVCAKKPAENPEPKPIVTHQKPIVPDPEVVPFPTQTLAWGISKIDDIGLVKIWNTVNPKEMLKKFKSRELAEASLFEFGTSAKWTYATLHKLAKDCGHGEKLEEPSYITKGELKKVKEGNRKDEQQRQRIEAGKTKPLAVGPTKVEPSKPKPEPEPAPEVTPVMADEPKKTKKGPKATPPPPESTPEAPEATSDQNNEDEGLVAKAFKIIKNDISGQKDENPMSSTDTVAGKLRIPTKQAVRVCTRLAQNGMVTMEDDSTGDGPYFYVKLTKKGEDSGVEAANGIKIAGAPGRHMTYDGHTIHRLITENPRRPGTGGFESWEKIVDGMLFEEYIAAGGRSQDLKWDLERGWIELRAGEKKIKAEPNMSKLPVGKKLFTAHRLYKMFEKNPRREETQGWASWNLLKNGMFFEEYLTAGGRYQDLHWDFERGWVKIVDPSGRETFSDSPLAIEFLKSLTISDPTSTEMAKSKLPEPKLTKTKKEEPKPEEPKKEDPKTSQKQPKEAPKKTKAGTPKVVEPPVVHEPKHAAIPDVPGQKTEAQKKAAAALEARIASRKK